MLPELVEVKERNIRTDRRTEKIFVARVQRYLRMNGDESLQFLILKIND